MAHVKLGRERKRERSEMEGKRAKERFYPSILYAVISIVSSSVYLLYSVLGIYIVL